MLAALLDLEPLAPDRYRTRQHQQNFRNSLFGGQVLAQALMAAGLTVDDGRPAHSLHAYFLRAGHAGSPVEFSVARLRDGKNFSARSVSAIQDSRLILTLHASFHAPEIGFHHQPPAPSNEPSPDALAGLNNDKSTDRTINTEFNDPPLDYLPFNDHLKLTTPQPGSEARCWTRARGALPATALHHLCALAFASDVALLASALLPHEASLFSDNIFPASIDHSLWFHRVPAFNDWHQYMTDSPWAGDARALCRGQFFNTAGQLVATVAQEGLLRSKAPSA